MKFVTKDLMVNTIKISAFLKSLKNAYSVYIHVFSKPSKLLFKPVIE